MPAAEQLIDRLRGGGLRITRQRETIVTVLCRAPGALTAQEILAAARAHCPDVSQATVYRTVELLLARGLLRRVLDLDGGESLVMTTTAHGHHVICTGCGRVAEFGSCRLAETISAASDETGFTIKEHQLEFLGLCPSCSGPGEEDGHA